MTDKRKRPRMTAPGGKGKRPVVVELNPTDYRTLFELTLQAGTSMAETLRIIIRNAGESLK